MLMFVQIDISKAELTAFEDYEAKVLALLGEHGGKLLERLRSTNGMSEMHLLHFPDADALDAFRANPRRTALQDLWLRSGASSSVTEVRRLGLG